MQAVLVNQDKLFFVPYLLILYNTEYAFICYINAPIFAYLLLDDTLYHKAKRSLKMAYFRTLIAQEIPGEPGA